MIQLILSAVVAGLGLSMILGPAFFTLLQTSIDRGFKCAAHFALGIFISDCVLVGIAFLGASSALTNPFVKVIFGVIGSFLLMGYGWHMYKKRGNRSTVAGDDEPELPKEAPPFLVYVVKGFFLNIANPANWFFWFFWVGLATSQFTSADGDVQTSHLILFLSISLLTVLLMDLSKGFVAHQLKRWINERFLGLINKVLGIVLVGFGLYFLFDTLYPFLTK